MTTYDLQHFDKLTNNKLQIVDNMRNLILSVSQQIFALSKRAFKKSY